MIATRRTAGGKEFSYAENALKDGGMQEMPMSLPSGGSGGFFPYHLINPGAWAGGSK